MSLEYVQSCKLSAWRAREHDSERDSEGSHTWNLRVLLRPIKGSRSIDCPGYLLPLWNLLFARLAPPRLFSLSLLYHTALFFNSLPILPPTSQIKMEGFDSTHLQSLQSKYQAVLLDTVDELRRNGVNRYLSLPQVIVCGDQGSGKSSVLEAISGIHFPISDDLCTRFTTEVILRRASENMATVKLIPSGGATPTHKEKLMNFHKASISHADIPSLISEAKTIMGLTGCGTLSQDILQLEVSGPRLPHLTLVDLPGLIQHPKKEQTDENVQISMDLVRKYMFQPQTIMLAIVTATDDTSNQVVLETAKTADANGIRTMGIITKPDCIIKDSPKEFAFFALANNKEPYFKLDWHVLRNADINEREDPLFDRDEEEKTFLSSGIWKNLPASKRGVNALRARLSHVLYQHILRELPSLLREIDNEIATCKATLARVGSARDTPSSQRVHLTAVAGHFHDLVNAGSEGNYQDPFFRLTGSGLIDLGHSDKQNTRLRSNVRKAEQGFLDNMIRNGHTYEIVTDPSNLLPTGTDRDTRFISEDDYLQEIHVLLDHCKGKELPGSFTPLLVGDLFISQSKNWKDIAIEFVEDVWDLVKQFLNDVLVYVADESVRQAILEEVIDPAMDERLAHLKEKVIEVHSPYAGGYPATLNPRFVRKLENERQARRARRAGRTQSTTNFGASLNEIDEDSDKQACRELLDLMQAYYSVALDVFVDNVASLGVENCLINGLKDLLSPQTVSEMNDDMLKEIAFESEDIRELRNRTAEKQVSLQKSFDLCKRHARKLSLAQRNENYEAKNSKSPDPLSTTVPSSTIYSPGLGLSNPINGPGIDPKKNHEGSKSSKSTSSGFLTPSSTKLAPSSAIAKPSPAANNTTVTGAGTGSSLVETPNPVTTERSEVFGSPSPHFNSSDVGTGNGVFGSHATPLFGSPKPPMFSTNGTTLFKFAETTPTPALFSNNEPLFSFFGGGSPAVPNKNSGTGSVSVQGSPHASQTGFSGVGFGGASSTVSNTNDGKSLFRAGPAVSNTNRSTGSTFGKSSPGNSGGLFGAPPQSSTQIGQKTPVVRLPGASQGKGEK
jgi:Dynamin family/Dynamin central region